MPTAVPFILYVLAFVCFVLAALGINPSPRPNLVALGLASWVLAVILSGHPL